jgi:AcrR family transcriptional regulator
MPENPAPKDRGARGTGRISDPQLLDAARGVFAEFGFHDATMDAIAARANSTKPTLYAHFGSKEELHRATLERETNFIAGQLFRTYESVAGLPLNQQLRVSMATFFEFADSNPEGFRLLFGGDSGAPSASARDWLFDAMNRRVSDLVRRFSASHGLELGPSAEIVGAMLIGIAFYGARQAAMNPDVDAGLGTELATAFADAALRNIDREVLGQIDGALEVRLAKVEGEPAPAPTSPREPGSLPNV